MYCQLCGRIVKLVDYQLHIFNDQKLVKLQVRILELCLAGSIQSNAFSLCSYLMTLLLGRHHINKKLSVFPLVFFLMDNPCWRWYEGTRQPTRSIQFLPRDATQSVVLLSFVIWMRRYTSACTSLLALQHVSVAMSSAYKVSERKNRLHTPYRSKFTVAAVSLRQQGLCYSSSWLIGLIITGDGGCRLQATRSPSQRWRHAAAWFINWTEWTLALV